MGTEAAEGPVIEQQQNPGQGHQHRFCHQPKGKEKRDQQISKEGTFARDITGISEQGKHEEDTAEHVLAFRNPCYRFHPQRMYGEHGRDKGAAPGRAGDLLQEQEKQNHSECVQKHIREMMAAGVEPVHLAIKHVGK